MKIGVLVATGDSYINTILAACEEVGVVPEVLPWTKDIEADVKAIDEADITFLIIHGHNSHHGFRLAREVAERLGVEPLVVSSAKGDFPTYLPITVTGASQERIVHYITEGTEFGRGEGMDPIMAAIESLDLQRRTLLESVNR